MVKCSKFFENFVNNQNHKHDVKLTKCFVKIEKLSTENLVRIKKIEINKSSLKSTLKTIIQNDKKHNEQSFVKLEKISPGLISKLSHNEKKRSESQIKNEPIIPQKSESDQYLKIFSIIF